MILLSFRARPVLTAMLALATVAASATAQQVTQPGQGAVELPALPPGDGSISGEIVHPEGAERAANTKVILYGLASLLCFWSLGASPPRLLTAGTALWAAIWAGYWLPGGYSCLWRSSMAHATFSSRRL